MNLNWDDSIFAKYTFNMIRIDFNTISMMCKCHSACMYVEVMLLINIKCTKVYLAVIMVIY